MNSRFGPELLTTEFVDDLEQMTLYHIHLANRARTINPKTVDLPDAETAKHHAECLARSLTALRSEFSVDHLHDWQVRLTDKNGKTLGRYQISKLAAGRSPGRSDLQRRPRA